MRKKAKKPARQNEIARQMILRTGNHAGKHHNRSHAVATGRSRKSKHKNAQLTELGVQLGATKS